MVTSAMTFKRYEIKFLMNDEQRKSIARVIKENIAPDKYNQNTVKNVYLDTPNYLLARRSIEHPLYKEKLRLRCYNEPCDETEVFVELKKKYKGITYKRRFAMPLYSIDSWLKEEITPPKNQIIAEIDFFKHRYEDLKPRMVLNYDREAYVDEAKNVRITIDSNIRSDVCNITLLNNNPSHMIIPKEYSLMEIKTLGGVPLWLVQPLSEMKLYRCSFSKYGHAYKQMIMKQNTVIY